MYFENSHDNIVDRDHIFYVASHQKNDFSVAKLVWIRVLDRAKNYDRDKAFCNFDSFMK